MLKVGIVGWRGMVGSVLIQRMHEEKDFEKISLSPSNSSLGSILLPVDFDIFFPFNVNILA